MKLREDVKTKLEDQVEEYHARYHEFKEKGHPFWPDIIFEDTIAMIVVLAAIVGLTLIEGVPLGNVANPADTGYVPRPEWYFMFLFQLLKYFPGSLEWVGVAVVPGLAGLFLILLPFLDRRPARLPIRRPFAMLVAVAAVVGIFLLTVKAYETTPATAEEAGGIKLSAIQQMGRNIFISKGCTGCHSLDGAGSGMPLEGIGSRMSTEKIHNYVENPQTVNTSSVMPAFIRTMTHQEVEAVAKYLSVFK
ncbi:MAG: c-type cytochrome [Chloroflexi bacterium]|nr:c-type cytochrome [Chloroflexota bacterium]